MTTEAGKVIVEAQIRQILDNRAKAMYDKDINALMANYSPDVIEFDALDPLQYEGLDAARKKAEKWFGAYQGPISYEMRDLNITTGDSIAFCSFLYNITGTMKNGTQVDMWLRDTVCFSKIESKWIVTHEHTSVPFDGESGKASLTIKP